MVLPNLLCEQWRARTWCSSPKCPEPDLPFQICRKRTSYHLRLIDNFAHHLPTSTLLENIHFFICKYIYCIFKYICATTTSTYHWSKNTSSNWNIVCRSWLAFVKNNSVDTNVYLHLSNRRLIKPTNHYHWWRSPYVCITFFPVGDPVTLTPPIANDVKGIIIGVINVLQVTYKAIQMVKSKEDTSAIMTLTLLHHENVSQCINTTGYWIRFHRC